MQLENIEAIEKRLWAAADTLRANSNYASNEYFLTQFADQKAHDAGEFFTPISLVSLIAHVLDPEGGTVLDPACGSGGMFVQSARIVEEQGRAGFVMSSQASSADGGEAKLRQKLIETGDVDLMITIRSNFFYTRTVPCKLWFLNRNKPRAHRNKVLMLDARNVYIGSSGQQRV